MCLSTSTNKCSYEEKFLLWNDTFDSQELNFLKLPHDSVGNCVFHSQDVKWKIENKFHQFLDEKKLTLRD